MSVYLDKFWKFWDRFWKLCRWLEGAEGIGLVEETRNLEGTFTRTRQVGCMPGDLEREVQGGGR